MTIAGLQKIRGLRVSDERSFTEFRMIVGVYERGTAAIMRRIVRPGMVVADVGAHIGYFAVLLARLVGSEGQVFAFEPHAGNRAILLENVRRFGNVTVIPSAVADRPAESTLYESEGPSGTHSLYAGRYASKEAKTSVTTLDLSVGGQKLDFVKIDVEGGEIEVLQGMREQLRTSRDIQIILEFSPSVLLSRGVDPEMHLIQLADLGLTCYAIGEPTGELRPVASWKSPSDFIASVDKYINLLARLRRCR
jgi:FkbM family methyltransferase